MPTTLLRSLVPLPVVLLIASAVVFLSTTPCRDLPMIQAGLLLVVTVAVVASAAADTVRLAADPVARGAS